ncbi:MAG TPA: Uma2 family endonuclease [Pyrinomonadaceae bacterium]
MSRQLAKYWITVDEYERMGEAGIFSSDARLELLEGSIYELPRIRPPHAACVTYLSMLFHRLFDRKFIVSSQDPIRLDDYSEPQPDVALLRWRDNYYRDGHPTPADVLLIIEVADSTVESDRSYKMPLYAKAGIPEAWLVNLPDERIELYAEPVSGTYQTTRNFIRGEEVQAHTIADLRVAVAEVLG